MSEIPDVPDDVMKRLCTAVGKAELGDLYDETDCDWQYFLPEVKVMIAHLRAHPEDAAAVLGGELWDDTALDRLTLTVRWPLPEEADRG